ncbi:NACHT domain-containing protein [Streptomyces sp. NPDC004270]
MRVEAALGGSRRVLLRGEAGSGKTTLLRWLARRAGRLERSDPGVREAAGVQLAGAAGAGGDVGDCVLPDDRSALEFPGVDIS